MAGDIVISAEGLGKKYLIGHQGGHQRYATLREGIGRGVTRIARNLAGLARGRPKAGGDRTETFWALKDVNFEVEQGEILGIIGRNGAGKSTLLKILSRITEPSSGRVRLRGRVASLLEVGTGFHPELSGRENIFLNGSILGMSQAEIRRKFDEIVAFAEVEKFLDTPIKRYSSGMYMRLAFAVAAHLEPEILVVDEVLAVGDAEFQRKCLGKMEKVAGEGRSILFVSHNLAAISTLCHTGILLTNGVASGKEPIGAAIERYRQQMQGATAGQDWSLRTGSGEARIASFEIRGGGMLALGSPAECVFEVDFHTPVENPTFGILVSNALDEIMLDLRSSHQAMVAGRCLGRKRVTVALPFVGLLPGQYRISLWVNNARETRDIDFVKYCGSFEVLDPEAQSRSGRLDRAGAKFWVPSKWTIGPE